MCQWFTQKRDGNEEFLNDVWFSNEAHFLLYSYVNSKNLMFVGRPLQSKTCTVWVAISKHVSIEPFFFDGRGNAVTVRKERYILYLSSSGENS